MTDAAEGAGAREKQSVALRSILASGGLALAKLVVGLLTGSLGILSEAAHSTIDLGATVLTWVAVRYGDRPPDEDHPYGHGKIESVAALIETMLLFLTAGFIVREAVGRLLDPTSPAVETTWYALAVVAGSIAVDGVRAAALRRVARATGSPALEADALHFGTDMISSAVVLAGLGLVAAGFPKGDALAALGVALFVGLAGYGLGRRTIEVLIDTAPAGAAELIEAALAALPNVVQVLQVRVRPAGQHVQVEARIAVARMLPARDVQAAIEAAQAAIRGRFAGADATVRAEPVAHDEETVTERIRAIGSHRGLPVHHIVVQEMDGRLAIGFDLEVPGHLSLAAAHDVASELEEAIRRELGADTEIDTQIEPLAMAVTDGTDIEPELLDELRQAIEADCKRIPGLVDVHDLRARRARAGLFLTLHCLFDGGRPVDAVYAATDQLEARLKEIRPDVARVVIHAEPERQASAAE